MREGEILRERQRVIERVCERVYLCVCACVDTAGVAGFIKDLLRGRRIGTHTYTSIYDHTNNVT